MCKLSRAVVTLMSVLLTGCCFGCTPTPAPTPTLVPTSMPTSPTKPHIIYKGTTLTQGYDMGVDTADRLRNWVVDMHGSICMAYPGNQDWGAVFLTFGKSVLYGQRSGQDLSGYKTLSLELKGEKGGEYLSVGLKDKSDRDDGSERKYNVDVTAEWQPYTFPLADFDTADLTQLYVVIEFVFEPGTSAENVCFRNIQYLP